MKPPFDLATEEDEDNNNTTTFHPNSHTSHNEDSKPEIISCDSPSNLSARSHRSRSRDSDRHGSQRSRSSSPELEVDSPPPPRIIDSPVTEMHEIPINKKSNAFSVSALLRNDSDLSSKNSRKSPSISFTPLRYFVLFVMYKSCLTLNLF